MKKAGISGMDYCVMPRTFYWKVQRLCGFTCMSFGLVFLYTPHIVFIAKYNGEENLLISRELKRGIL